MTGTLRLQTTFAILGTVLGLGGCKDQQDVLMDGAGTGIGGQDTGIDSGNSGDDGDDTAGDRPRNATERCETSRLGPPMLRRLTQTEYLNTVADIFPGLMVEWSGGRLGVDPVSKLGFSNDAEILQVGPQSAKEFYDTAEEIANLATRADTLGTLLPCSTGTPDAACARTFVEDYGPRLFRRPLEATEVTTYVDHFSSISAASDFATGIKWTLVGLMQSPKAIYRSEVGALNGEMFELTPYEVASELAYSFGGGPPSSDLIAMAESGALDDPQMRVAEARRLLATPRGREIVHRFFREWIRYSAVESATRPDPAFETIRSAMAEETQRFIESVLDEGGDVRDLLVADYTYLDAALSTFYGYGNVSGEFQQVVRPAEWGRGILAQGSVLATYAHNDYSSPTLRGLAVFDRVLCNLRPTPPNDVPALNESAGQTEGLTTRQRYEQAHAVEAFCAGCHAQFDPLGFAFEHFDEMGRYRETENGLAIDPSGRGRIGGELVEFADFNDLTTKLADTEPASACVTGLLSLYTFGGAGGEVCVAEEARTDLIDGNIGLLDFIAELAAAPHFTTRRG